MSVFGIDFGTTNSSAFELPLAHRYGDQSDNPLPSIIAINKATGTVIGGREAANRRVELQEHGAYEVITSVKRYLDSDHHWVTNERRWSPVQVAAEVLKQLSRRAESLGVAGGIRRATLSVPVGLSPVARRNLRMAAQLAGIEATGFVNESTAAFMRYWHDLKTARFVAVFDWGGGTLDVSVLEVRGDTLYERATAGLPRAGDIIDEDLSLLLHRLIMKERGQSLSFEEMKSRDRDDLLVQAERAKRLLRDKPETVVALEQYAGAPAQVILTRDLARSVVEPHVRAGIELLAATVQESGIPFDALDETIAIGGSSRLWLLSQRLEEDSRFMASFRQADNPEWDVAHGAALVEERPGRYALAETLALQLSDRTYHELVRPGDAPMSEDREVSVSLIEDAKQANLVVDRWRDGEPPTNALQFSVRSLGFLEDEIRLKYRITDELTLRVNASSLSLGNGHAEVREFAQLRFGYRLGG